MTRWLSSVITVLLVGSWCVPALALTNEDIYAQFQFNFITPGARATAMGGAFIGLADDATAAATNPAGLTALQEPEVSAEYKYISYSTKQIFENSWTWYTDDDGIPYQFTQSPIRKMEFEDSVISFPFISAVYPFEKVVLSVYRQELANYKSSYRSGSYPIFIPESSGWWYPIDTAVEMKIINYGVGAAIEVREGLSVAVSPRWSQMDMTSHQTYFDSGLNSPTDSSDNFDTPTDFSDEDVRGELKVDDGDDGFSLNAGIKWEPHSKFSIGAVYRSGTEFTVKLQPGRGGFSVLDPFSTRYDPDLEKFTLKVPDSFGAGIAFRPSDSLTLTIDAVHIRYEDLLKDFDVLYKDELSPDNFTVDNVTELHLGVEYILVLPDPEAEHYRTVTLRAGVYDVPDHAIRFTGKADSSFDTQAYRSRFPGGEDQVHITGGIGIMFNKFTQVDMAADIADNVQQVSVSLVYRF